MRKIILLLGLLIPAAPLRAPDDVFTSKVLRFEITWDKFIRRMFGCPEGRVLTDPASECHPATGRIDYSVFRQTCLRAADLYNFPMDVCRAE